MSQPQPPPNRPALEHVYEFLREVHDDPPADSAMLLAIADELRTANLIALARFYAEHGGGPGFKLSKRYSEAAADRLPTPPLPGELTMTPTPNPLLADTAEEGLRRTKAIARDRFDDLILEVTTPQQRQLMYAENYALADMLQNMFINGFVAGYPKGASDAIDQRDRQLSNQLDGLVRTLLQVQAQAAASQNQNQNGDPAP